MPDTWFRLPVTDAPLRLFCLPYAGGNASMFAPWQQLLGPDIEVMAAHLPGRLKRIKEVPIRAMPELARELSTEMRPYLDRRFALFGISMGALAAYETLRLLESAGFEAVRLIVASYPAPSLPLRRRPMHAASDEEFTQMLRVIGAAPRALLDSAGMLEIVLPAVRADFELTETYKYSDRPPIRASITAIYGADDHVTSKYDMAEWSRETGAGFDLLEIGGGHFMVHSAAKDICSLIQTSLTGETNR